MHLACRRALRPAPARIPEADLQQLLKSLERQPASLANCFNTGICNWLCHHRCADRPASLKHATPRLMPGLCRSSAEACLALQAPLSMCAWSVAEIALPLINQKLMDVSTQSRSLTR